MEEASVSNIWERRFYKARGPIEHKGKKRKGVKVSPRCKVWVARREGNICSRWVRRACGLCQLAMRQAVRDIPDSVGMGMQKCPICVG